MKVGSTLLSSTSNDTVENKKLKQACKDFESIFMDYMLKSMRKTVSKSSLFGSTENEDMFQDMEDSEYCKNAAKDSSLGIADALYSQLSKLNTQLATNCSRGETK